MFSIIIFYGIPIAAIAFFIVSLCRFVSAGCMNKKETGTFSV